MILIGKGRWFTPAALEAAKKVSGAILVNWATDDPFNPADSSRELVKSIPLYDLYVCTKKDIMNDVRGAGCANVAYVRFGYKPEVHFPEAPATDEERERFACDVMFVGGCDAHRIAYFEALDSRDARREAAAIRMPTGSACDRCGRMRKDLPWRETTGSRSAARR